jgi:acetyl esterase/lipase
VTATEQDIEYLRVGDRPLLARLYRPGGRGPFPAVVSVHGGAWGAGDRLENGGTARAFADAGIAVFSLDFRNAPDGVYPEPVAEINAGIRYLKAHAHELGVIPDLVGGIGFSSGGHQLMLAALRPDDPRYTAVSVPGAGAHDSRLAFAILLYAVLDPLARYRMVTGAGKEHLIARHHAYWADEGQMTEGNPVLLLERGEVTDPARLPAVLVVQGRNDGNLTPDMGPRFAAAYRAAGGRAELQMYDDAPHGFVRQQPELPVSQDATALLLRFAADVIQQRAAGKVTP